jgi:tetratricopeptide (TPR) repeat protein
MQDVDSERRGSANLEVVTLVFALALGLGGGFLVARGTATRAGDAAADEAARADVAAEELRRRDAELAAAEGPGALELDRATTDGGTRREVRAEDAAAAPPVDLAALAAANPLVADLSSLLADPDLLARVGADDAAATGFLMHLYLGLGDLDAALALAQRTPTSAGTWAQLAGAFDGVGRGADAANAYAAALEAAGRFAWEEPLASWASRLAELDPARGLVVLERNSSATGDDPGVMQLALARSMARTGREEEARATLLALVQRNAEVSSALAALAEFDPALAESELRRLIGLGGQSALEVQLAQLLVSQGRTEDAIAAIEAGLRNPGDQAYAFLSTALSSLSGAIDDERLSRWVESAGPGSGFHQMVGQHFADNGDLARALPYIEEGWQRQLENESYLSALPQSLIDAQPQTARALVDAAASRAGDRDEVWGDVADHYWRLGDAAAAENAYRRANQLDPGDGEWTGKLAALAEGRSPF